MQCHLFQICLAQTSDVRTIYNVQALHTLEHVGYEQPNTQNIRYSADPQTCGPMTSKVPKAPDLANFYRLDSPEAEKNPANWVLLVASWNRYPAQRGEQVFGVLSFSYQDDHHVLS